MLKVALPVVMALSWATARPSQVPAATPAQQKAPKPAQAAETIVCPVTGATIPSCCCPVKK